MTLKKYICAACLHTFISDNIFCPICDTKTGIEISEYEKAQDQKENRSKNSNTFQSGIK